MHKEERTNQKYQIRQNCTHAGPSKHCFPPGYSDIGDHTSPATGWLIYFTQEILSSHVSGSGTHMGTVLNWLLLPIPVPSVRTLGRTGEQCPKSVQQPWGDTVRNTGRPGLFPKSTLFSQLRGQTTTAEQKGLHTGPFTLSSTGSWELESRGVAPSQWHLICWRKQCG